MNSSVLVLLLALPCAATPQPAPVETSTAAPAATPPPGSLDSSKIRLDAHDVPGALADAELVVAKGGGADAFAARADAKRALGRPMDEVLADYAQAAKLDPRYLEKYNGLIAQIESEKHPKAGKGSAGLGGVPIGFVALGGAIGVAFIVGAVLLARRRGRKPPAPDDEAIHPAGQEQKKPGTDIS